MAGHNKMNVRNHEGLSVVEILYSFKYGGSERVGASLAKYFHEAGIPVGAIGLYSDKGPIGRELEAAGVPVLALGDLVVRGRPFPILFRRRLRRFIAQFGKPSLHIHHGLCLGMMQRFLGGIDYSRIVYTEHSVEPLQRMAYYRRDTVKWARRHADAITVLHTDMHKYFVEELGLPREKTITIPNGVPVPESLPCQRALDERASVQLIWVGRIDGDKDLPTLIDAMRIAVPAAPTRIRLQIVGDGESRADLERCVLQANLGESIEFLGFRSDVTELMSKSDMFVMSSKNEGMPMVILEAMSMGLPCVSTDAGGIGDCVDAEVGRLVPVGDSGKLADAILELVADPSELARLGRQAHARARERFSLDASARKYIEALAGAA